MTGNEQGDVKEQSSLLLDGPLKHVRAAALAAALVPLASVVATPAMAQQGCSGGATIGDYVWNDLNKNGVQESGEPGMKAVVTLKWTVDAMPQELTVESNDDGLYDLGGSWCAGTYRVEVRIPNGYQVSPKYAGDPQSDSNGEPDNAGNVYETVELLNSFDPNTTIDFGFYQGVQQPGTGTPGYWKNHPEAWPETGITVGGRYYPKELAIEMMNYGGSDKAYTMFNSLVSAMLNVRIGNDSSCVASTIAAADAWMGQYAFKSTGKVAASSYAWKVGEPHHRLMDNYNNGGLCAPHRD
jgi:hypothetical protein